MAEFRTSQDQDCEIWIYVAQRSEENAAIQAIRARIDAGELTASEVAAGEFGELLTIGEVME